MSARSRQRHKESSKREKRATTASNFPKISARPQRQTKHRWLARLIASVGIPLLLFGSIELALRISGYGYSTTFFEPVGDGKMLTTNQRFAWQFYSRAKATSPTPLLFKKEKPPGTRRVFILGESAAAGTPDPAFGFARQLQLMLEDQYPTNRIEVLNAAMRGIDSHIIRQIAAECAKLSPDLFIVYAGNNEMIGLHAPSPEKFQLTANVHWLRLQHAVKRMKLAQLADSLLTRARKNRPAPEQDMEFFRRQRLALDDSKREAIYQNFAINLRSICGFADSTHAKAIVCTVGVNLRDFPPLGSLHRRDLSADQLTQWEQLYSAGIEAEARHDFPAAISSYEQAARLDNHFAELLFRMARCYEAAGKHEEARKHYMLARDWDAIQFRTDSRLNEIIRSVAASAGSSVRLVDMEKQFAASSLAENGVPGAKIFHEHVHLKFEGDHHLASSLLPEVANALKLSSPSKSVLTRDECARRLAYTPLDEGNMKVAIARLTANSPFLDQIDHAARQSAADREVQERMGQVGRDQIEQAIATYHAAIQARPEDWMLHFNLANLLTQINQPQAAAAEFAEVMKRLPGQRNFHVAYGNALLQAGRRSDAADQFAAALKIDPDYGIARQGLKACGGR